MWSPVCWSWFKSQWSVLIAEEGGLQGGRIWTEEDQREFGQAREMVSRGACTACEPWKQGAGLTALGWWFSALSDTNTPFCRKYFTTTILLFWSEIQRQYISMFTYILTSNTKDSTTYQLSIRLAGVHRPDDGKCQHKSPNGPLGGGVLLPRLWALPPVDSPRVGIGPLPSPVPVASCHTPPGVAWLSPWGPLSGQGAGGEWREEVTEHGADPQVSVLDF